MGILKRIKKNIENDKAQLNSLVGSICVTIAILSEQSEEAAYREFCKLRREFHHVFTTRQMFKKAWIDMVTEDHYKANIPFAVLLTAEYMQPKVTAVIEGHALPLRRDGLETGIISMFNATDNKHDIQAEPLFDSLEDFENEEV